MIVNTFLTGREGAGQGHRLGSKGIPASIKAYSTAYAEGDIEPRRRIHRARLRLSALSQNSGREITSFPH